MIKGVRLTGFGGQGIGLAGLILGKAISLFDGLEAVMTQAYGPEARGGASSANIVVSDELIDYPFVQQPDILVAMSQEAYTKFRPTAKPQALILIDEGLVSPNPGDKVYSIPATQLAEELGRRIVANVVMLGFFTAVTELVSREAMEKSLEVTLSSKVIHLNINAFSKGFEHFVGEYQSQEQAA